MIETPRDYPNSQELLEKIIQLEGKTARLEKQQVEMESLKAQIADIGAAFRSNVTHNSDHFQSIYQYLADIHDQLWPLVHKVFPGSAKTQDQIAEAIRTAGRSWDEKKRK